MRGNGREGLIRKAPPTRWQSDAGRKGSPVRQGPGEVALDVRVHHRLEVMEFAVLQQIDDVNLRRKRSFRKPQASPSGFLILREPSRSQVSVSGTALGECRGTGDTIKM